MNVMRTARGLGWFSIGLGLAEVAATKTMAKAVRLHKRPQVVRIFGIREIATGLGILSQKRRSPWLWARVAGDVMDLMALGTAKKGSKMPVAIAAVAVAGVTALDVVCGRRLNKMGF